MNLIEFTNVTKIYRKGFRAIKVPAVVNLSFSVPAGRIVGFIGPNGAGKTTSIKMLLGLVRPTSGVISIAGRQAPDPASRSGIAFLPEQPYFYDHLTVRESLRFAFRLLGRPAGAMDSEIARALAAVRLSDVASKKVKELSKGMLQRLNMASALLTDATLFVFDEPMSGLDPPGRTLFRGIFRELAARGTTIFFSTHILEDIEALCDGIVVLSKGRLVYEGEISRLLAQGFLGTDIVIKSLGSGLQARLAALGCEVTTTADGVCVFVPRDKDPRECQKMLHDEGIYCESIARRNQSLETLLYSDTSTHR